MNTTSCPSGFATDSVIYYGNTIGNCDASAAGFYAVGGITTGVRLLLAVQQSRVWFAKENRSETKKLRMTRKFPLVPFCSLAVSIVFLVLYVFIATDTGNTSNNVPSVLFGIGYTFFGLLCLLYVAKFVSLGHRIIPKAKLMNKIDGIDALSKFDALGKVGLIMCFCTLSCQTVFFCVMPYVIDPTTAIQVGYGMDGAFLFSQNALVIYHISRVKAVVRASRDATKNIATGKSTIDLNNVLGKLTEQQAALIMLGSLSIVFDFVVASGVIPLRWFVLYVTMAIEVCFGLLIEISNNRARKRRHHRSANNDTQIGSFVERGDLTYTDEQSKSSTLETGMGKKKTKENTAVSDNAE